MYIYIHIVFGYILYIWYKSRSHSPWELPLRFFSWLMVDGYRKAVRTTLDNLTFEVVPPLLRMDVLNNNIHD